MALRLLHAGRPMEASDDELAAHLDRHASIVLDVGAGNAKAALRFARRHPEALVIAVDANADAMLPQASRSARKPSRGGTANILFIVADATELPAVLEGRVDELSVILPWASLLRSVVLADEGLLIALRRVLKPGGVMRVVLNLEPLHERVPREMADLPVVDLRYVETVLAPAYARRGLLVEDVRPLDAEEKRAIGSAWAKRLTRSRSPEFLVIEARAT